MAFGHVPHHDHTLHQPHPGGQLLNAVLTPVLRPLYVQSLLAVAETLLYRPALGEGLDDPLGRCPHHRREQIGVLELPLRVSYHHQTPLLRPQPVRPSRQPCPPLYRPFPPVAQPPPRLPPPLPCCVTSTRLRRL